MKNIILTALFLLTIVVISCKKEAINHPANAIKVTAQDASDKTLKTEFINPSVNWLAGQDHIGLFSDLAYTTTPDEPATNVDYIAQSTGTTSTFSSTTPVYWNGSIDYHNFAAYYPYTDGTFPLTEVPIILPALQDQVGATKDHIGPLDFEVASILTLFPEPGNNPVVAFTFNHVFTILKFDITCSVANTLSGIVVTKSGPPSISLNAGSTIDISTYPTPDLYNITEAPGGTPLTVILSSNMAISSTAASAYMIILPGDHTGTGNFTINFVSLVGKVYTLVKDGINFERGKVYTITVPITVGGANGW